MDIDGLVSLFRKDMVDEASPPLWSDEEVFGYLDDAQREFAREIGGLQDSSSAISRVAVAVGQETFRYDQRILTIRDAYRVSDGRAVDVLNYKDLAKSGLRFDGSTGPLACIVIGMDECVARLLPIPSIADEIQMIVERLPLCSISLDEQENKLEVHEMHHRALLLRMKELAYSKQDAETLDTTRSKDFGVQFLAYCGKVKMEKERRRHKPRAVLYGGLPIGIPRRRDY